jgi:hypothetical protein
VCCPYPPTCLTSHLAIPSLGASVRSTRWARAATPGPARAPIRNSWCPAHFSPPEQMSYSLRRSKRGGRRRQPPDSAARNHYALVRHPPEPVGVRKVSAAWEDPRRLNPVWGPGSGLPARAMDSGFEEPAACRLNALPGLLSGRDGLALGVVRSLLGAGARPVGRRLLRPAPGLIERDEAAAGRRGFTTLLAGDVLQDPMGGDQ